MLELLAGVGVGMLVGSGGSRVPDNRSDLEELSRTTKEAGRSISNSLDGVAVAVEATGHRETVRYEEVFWLDRSGVQIRDARGLAKVLDAAAQAEPWRYQHLVMLQHSHLGFSYDFDLTEAMVEAGLIFRFEVHHFWNVVVGLQSRRHSYRCLPDGMAREIHSNPENWR